MNLGNIVKIFVDATLHVIYAVVKLLVLPINLWAKAAARLAEQKNQGLLDINTIRGIWPFFSYIRVLLVEFMFDAVAFLAYPLGILFAFGALFTYIIIFDEQVWIALGVFVWIILGVYVTPIAMALCRDTFQLLLLPVHKILDWFRKPAQYVDINVTKND